MVITENGQNGVHIVNVECKGEKFTIDMAAATKSVTIKKMLEEMPVQDGQTEPIPLDNIKADTLKKVFEWCEHHKGDAIPADTDDNTFGVDVPEWDQEFLKLEHDKIFELILAANRLEIEGLTLSACATIASKMNDKSPEEIRKTFDVKDKENVAQQNGNH